MNKAQFLAYSIPTLDYPIDTGFKLDHVFVVTSEGDDWGCFGRGRDYIPQAKQIAQGLGYAKWGNMIRGGDETGLQNLITGTCHNVANRLLVLAGTGVSAAVGDALVLLFYGKYGFNVDAYINRVQSSAAAINEAEPGALSDNEISDVINKVTGGMSDELEILEQDFQDALQPHNESLRWTPKIGPPVKMDFYRSAGEKKADYESKTETA